MEAPRIPLPTRHQVKSPALVQALCFANEEIEFQKEQVTHPRSPSEWEQRQVPRKFRPASTPSREAHSRTQDPWCVTRSLVPADAMAALGQGVQKRGTTRLWWLVPRACAASPAVGHGSQPSLWKRDLGVGVLTQQLLSHRSIHHMECSSGNTVGWGMVPPGHTIRAARLLTSTV